MATNHDDAFSYRTASRLIARRYLPVFALLIGGCFSPDESVETDSPDTATEDATGSGGASMTAGGSTGGPGSSTASTTMGNTTTGTEGTTGMETGVGPVTTDEGSESSSGGDTGSDTGSESSEAGTSTVRECMGECIDLGADWNGPVRLFEGDAAPECDDEATPEFTAFSGLNAPPAECGCSCGAPDVACPDTGTIVNRGDPGPNCLAFVPPVWSEDVGPGCNDIPNALDLSVLRLSVDQPAGIDDASCASSASTEIAPAAWDSEWAGCGADAAVGDCEVCSTNTEDMCIWQEGDVECDVAGFSEKTLLHSDFTDARECSECSCGDVAGSCDATVTYRALDGCTLAVVGTGGASECVEVEFARGADLEFSGTLSCGPADVSPMGDATPTNPITACCAG